jgi:murein DD-endopeptidase MepM/ murein hydrolase activator NlpD
VRRTIVLTVLLAAVPASADARYATTGPATPLAPFPVAGAWEWGGPDTAFGDRGGSHDGVDVMSPCGTPVLAPAAGRVVFTESGGAAGHYLVMRVDGSGEHHVFMHLRRPPRAVKGDAIAAAERIGAVGRSGNASACHLHFEIWRAPGWQRGPARDPRRDLERWAGSSGGGS